ncbi:MAG TPA: AI-2E family transporter [Casimicrobiaceae bacterium]|nr:AI-2E family transporter [Casimicrobiaceae bacterium]
MASENVAHPRIVVGARAEPAAPRKFSVAEIALVCIAVCAAIAVARIAQPFLVPVVMGILLSYALRPLVSMLERVRVPRFAAATTVIAILLALGSTAVYVVRDDVNGWVAELPAAARKVRQAVADSARQAPGPMTNMKAAAEELDKAAAEASGKPWAAPEPVRASVSAQFQELVREQSGKALGVIAEIFVALLLALFLLVAGDTFRRKVARIAGASLTRRRVTVEVLDAIDGQIQKYLITMLFANALIALATWGALALLHVPNAGILGGVTGLIHVVPYAGTAVAATAVGVAAFVETASFGDAVVATTVVVAIAAAIGMGLATWMQGRAAHMNPVAVFIGLLFFGWLWGGWGLLLGVPILAVLKSIADRVEAMLPVSELLST